MKNITHVYQAVPGSNVKPVISFSFCAIKSKRKIISYEIVLSATHFPLLIKDFYYLLILHSIHEMSETYSLLDTT